MKHEHTIILVLLVTALILSIVMVTKKAKAEHFAVPKEEVCERQAQMVADAPYIGGSFQQAYANCMSQNYDVMPSAYVSM